MGQPTAIIAPLADDPVDVPTTARTPSLRCKRLGATVEQFFDPCDIQSFTFEEGWNEMPGVSRLLGKAQKEFQVLSTAWPDWTIAGSAFGIYYPFFALAFGRSETYVAYELPVWPVGCENLGRYVHRFLTSAVENENLVFSERSGCRPKLESSVLPIVKETLELAQGALDGILDRIKLHKTFELWTRMSVVRNAFHKHGTATLQGKGIDGSDLTLAARTSVRRYWQCANFDCRLKPRQEARLIFRPPLRSVYIRSSEAESDDGHAWPLHLQAGGAARIEDFDDNVRLFVPYAESAYARFMTPAGPNVRRISLEIQVRDDPVSQFAILEGVTKAIK